MPRNLRRHRMAERFETVTLSSGTTHRKPGTLIFLLAARTMGVSPAQCAYVGDTINRDINGAAAAGFGVTVQIPSALTAEKDDGLTRRTTPTHVIARFGELLDLFV